MRSSPTSSPRRTACSCSGTRTRSRARPTSPRIRSSPTAARPRRSTGTSSPVVHRGLHLGRARDAARAGAPARAAAGERDVRRAVPLLRLRDLLELVDASRPTMRRGCSGSSPSSSTPTYFESIGLPLDELFAAELPRRAGTRRRASSSSRASRRRCSTSCTSAASAAQRVYLLEDAGAPADRVARAGRGGARATPTTSPHAGLYALAAARRERVDGDQRRQALVLARVGPMALDDATMRRRDVGPRRPGARGRARGLQLDAAAGEPFLADGLPHGGPATATWGDWRRVRRSIMRLRRRRGLRRPSRPRRARRATLADGSRDGRRDGGGG